MAEEQLIRVSFKLPETLNEQIRAAVVAIQELVPGYSREQLGREALWEHLARLQIRHNDGLMFPAVIPGPLRLGRPKKSLQTLPHKGEKEEGEG